MTPSLALALLLALPPQDPEAPPDAWAEVALGTAWIRLDAPGAERDWTFAMDFHAGLWLGTWGIGLRLGGFTIESGDLGDPSQGASVSEAFALLRYRPGKDLVLSLEAGWASTTFNAPGAMDLEGDGWGGRAGAAWRFPVHRNFWIGPSIALSRGRINPDHGTLDPYAYWGVALLLGAGIDF